MYNSLRLFVTSLIAFMSERLCSFSTPDDRHDLGFTSNQIYLSDSWGQKELAVDLLLFSTYK